MLLARNEVLHILFAAVLTRWWQLMRSHAQLVLVGSQSAVQRLQPLRDFLAELGISFTTCGIDSLHEMDRDRFYCFHIHNPEEARTYGQRFAGVSAPQQMISCGDMANWGVAHDDERSLMLNYSAVLEGAQFVEAWMEILGSKLTVFLHSRRMAADVQAAQMDQVTRA